MSGFDRISDSYIFLFTNFVAKISQLQVFLIENNGNLLGIMCKVLIWENLCMRGPAKGTLFVRDSFLVLWQSPRCTSKFKGDCFPFNVTYPQQGVTNVFLCHSKPRTIQGLSIPQKLIISIYRILGYTWYFFTLCIFLSHDVMYKQFFQLFKPMCLTCFF